jgi:hypothetical protein
LASCCSEEEATRHCESVNSACAGAPTAETFPLLDTDSINQCLETAGAADESACLNELENCQRVCTLPVAPAQEARLYGCWSGDARFCFGSMFVPGASSTMAYAYWASAPLGGEPPDARGEFETLETMDRVAFYSHVGPATTGCARARLRGTQLYLTEILVEQPPLQCDSSVEPGAFIAVVNRE